MSTSTNTAAKRENAENGGMSAKKLTVLAMFAALAYLCLFVFRFKVSFLSLEIKDSFITMAGFVFGPLTAVGLALAESLLEMVTLSDTGIYGAVMNFAGSAAFAGVASLIYKYRKTLGGALAGLISAAVVMSGVMILMNILITPLYMKVPRSVVVGMIPTLLLPFNLIKGSLNSGMVFLLYKPLSEALKGIGMLPKKEDFRFGKKSVIVLIAAAAVIAAAVVCIIMFLDGDIEWVRSAG